MEEKLNDKVLTIPNILSFFRIALIPFIMWAYFTKQSILCAVLVVVSFLTDVCDGFIARRFNMISALGKALDPIADKLTLMSLFFCISVDNALLYYLLILFVVKEVIVGAEGLIIVKLSGTTYSAKWYGKITTGIMYASALSLVLFDKMPFVVTQIIFIICVCLNLLSLILYSVMNIRRIISLREQEND